MPTYILVYRRPPTYVPTPDTTPHWQAFLAAIGDRLVDRGLAVFSETTEGDCSPDSTVLGGYSLIEAEDLAAARELARGCPHLLWGGGVEVGELSS
ncbi:MAG: hypothetical protein KGQ66_00325 [Acidobacteriota bacterium]|nr:hypothetical protein [Acidobacteriota bacterium]